MEESRQGPPHIGAISRNEIKSPLRRFAEQFITVVCWILYLYLLLPILTLVLWVFGIQTIYDEVLGVGGHDTLVRLLTNGGITTLVIFTITAGWARYNYAQFKRRGDRRSSRVRISSDHDISRWLGVGATAMAEIRLARRMEVYVDKDGYRIRGTAGPTLVNPNFSPAQFNPEA